MSGIIGATTLPLPNTPTTLAASAVSGSKIGLSWTETLPPQGLPIGGYQIYCGLTPSSLSKVGTSGSLSYIYAGLTASTTYYCAVQATDTSGNVSPMSAAVSAATDGLPNPPTSVAATANSSSKVTVTWTETVLPGGLPIAGYQIFRGTSPSNLTQVATRATATYVDTTVSPLATYYYAIAAQDSGNDVSPMSVSATVTVP